MREARLVIVEGEATRLAQITTLYNSGDQKRITKHANM